LRKNRRGGTASYHKTLTVVGDRNKYWLTQRVNTTKARVKRKESTSGERKLVRCAGSKSSQTTKNKRKMTRRQRRSGEKQLSEESFKRLQNQRPKGKSPLSFGEELELEGGRKAYHLKRSYTERTQKDIHEGEGGRLFKRRFGKAKRRSSRL